MSACVSLSKKENDILDYYYSYCELNVWFKKVMVESFTHAFVPIEQIKKVLLAEQKRIIKYVPKEHKSLLTKELHIIAEKYILQLVAKEASLSLKHPRQDVNNYRALSLGSSIKL